MTAKSETTFLTKAIYDQGLCNLEFVPFSGQMKFLAFAFPKRSRLTKFMNWALYNRYYSSYDFDSLWLKSYTTKHKKTCKIIKEEETLKPYAIEDFAPSVLLYIACLFLPIVCLFCELLFYRQI